MATVPDLIHRIKDTENLAEQVESLKQLAQIIDPAKHKLAFNFLKELSTDDIYYPELRPYAVKCLEFVAKKHSLELEIPAIPTPAAQEQKPAAPAPKGPTVGPAPPGAHCSACDREIAGNCVTHEVPIQGEPRALRFCSKACYGEINEVVEKLVIAATVRKVSGADLLEKLGEETEPAES